MKLSPQRSDDSRRSLGERRREGGVLRTPGRRARKGMREKWEGKTKAFKMRKKRISRRIGQ